MGNELICRPVILVTSTFSGKEQTLWKNSNGQILFTHSSTPAGLQPQHLYLVSDREIKEGDKYITYDNTICERYASIPLEGSRKVEATTDKSLGLSLIPQSFIEEYVQKQGEIDKVEIKMLGPNRLELNMSVSSALGEVIIFPIKDSWNKKEVLSMFKVLTRHMRENNAFISEQQFDEWFDKNY